MSEWKIPVPVHVNSEAQRNPKNVNSKENQ